MVEKSDLLLELMQRHKVDNITLIINDFENIYNIHWILSNIRNIKRLSIKFRTEPNKILKHLFYFPKLVNLKIAGISSFNFAQSLYSTLHTPMIENFKCKDSIHPAIIHDFLGEYMNTLKTVTIDYFFIDRLNKHELYYSKAENFLYINRPEFIPNIFGNCNLRLARPTDFTPIPDTIERSIAPISLIIGSRGLEYFFCSH